MSQNMCMARIEVDTDSLTEVVEQLKTAGETNQDLAVDVSLIAAQVTALLSFDPTGEGLHAGAILTATGAKFFLLSQGHKTLSAKVETARNNYIDAERLATEILQGPEGYVPGLLYLAGKSVATGGVLGEKIADKVPFASIVSPLVARALFGMGYYADLKMNGESFARKRRDERMGELGMSASWRRDVGKYLKEFGVKTGVVRDLNDSSVRVEKLEGKKEYEDATQPMFAVPVTPYQWAHNLELVGKGEDAMDALDGGDGEIIEYDGLRVQVVRDGEGNTIAANVYVPGTDPDSPAYSGGLSTWSTNVASINADNLDTLEESTAMMQLVDRALSDAGISSDVPVNLGGFSQGAATVSALSTNKEFVKKYKVNYLYMQGGPTGDMKVSPNIPTVIVADRNDPVPHLQGSSTYPDRGKNVRTIETNYDITPEGIEKFKERDVDHLEQNDEHIKLVTSMPVHGYDEYTTATEAIPQSHIPEQSLLDIRDHMASTENYEVSGSSFAPGTSQQDISLNRALGIGSGAYDVTEKILNNTASKGAKLPGLPEDYSSTEFYDKYVNPLGESPKAFLYTGVESPALAWVLNPSAQYFEPLQASSQAERFSTFTPALKPAL